MQARLLYHADRYIKGLTDAEQIKLAGAIRCLLNNETTAVRTKQLRGSVRELIVGNHRVTYFKLEDSLYFVRGFRKKTAKTPRNEIEYAERIYNALKVKK